MDLGHLAMQTQKATIIVEGTFKEGYENYFEEYSKRVREFISKNNGVTIRRQLITKTLYGQRKPNLIILIDFPSIEIAGTIFFDAEYISIIPLRDKIFAYFNMYLADFGGV